MGLMGLFSKRKKNEEPENKQSIPDQLITKEPEDVTGVDTGVSGSMSNAKISLQKHSINLTKSLNKLSLQKDVDISNLKARVVVAIDHSGSMSPEYNGRFGHRSNVQLIFDKLFPIALKFDDDGQMDMWLFDSKTYKLEPMTMDNFENYVDVEIEAKNIPYGGTRYSQVIEEIMSECLTGRGLKSDYPVFVIFITDGEAFDEKQTDETIRKSSKGDIFIQFIGVGTDCSFKYLRALDDLDGRECDNTGFEAFSSLANADDEEVYEKIIAQFVDWLKFKSGVK